MPPQPEKIEVKFAVALSHGVAMLERLKLDDTPPDESRTVHFFDTVDKSLFESGVILRSRQTITGNDPHDVTFKVRGPGAEVVAGDYLGITEGAKYEGDLNMGAQEKPSFSIKTETEPAKIRKVLAGDPSLDSLFGEEARRLLDAKGIGWEQLQIYGPIHARVWEIKPKALGKKITVEHWDTGTARLLEISDKVDREEAADFIRDFGKFLEDVPQLEMSKTLFAMKSLKPRPFR